MKLAFLVILSIFSHSSLAQMSCFENEKVKTLDLIDLEENIPPLSDERKIIKLVTAKKDLVKETKVSGYSMNSGPLEEVKVNYYMNSKGEDVAVYKYNGQKYYKVRNLKNGCTALFSTDAASKKITLLISRIAEANDSFFINGVPSANYIDTDLDVQTDECRIVNDGVSRYSVNTNSNGQIQFCRIDAICKGRPEIVKAYCLTVQDKCPSYENCEKDKSFSKIFNDFQKGTLKKEPLSKTSGQ